MSLYNDIFGIDGKKPKINSKNKGNRNEVDVAKFLTAWVGRDFRRTPASGALGGNLAGASGDVTTADGKLFDFSIETKHYAKLSINKVLRKNSKIFTFWEQAKRDAERTNTYPLLIVRENGMSKGSFIIFFDYMFRDRLLRCGVKNVSYGYNGKYTIVGYYSEDIINVDYKKFIGYGKNRNKDR